MGLEGYMFEVFRMNGGRWEIVEISRDVVGNLYYVEPVSETDYGIMENN